MLSEALLARNFCTKTFESLESLPVPSHIKLPVTTNTRGKLNIDLMHLSRCMRLMRTPHQGPRSRCRVLSAGSVEGVGGHLEWGHTERRTEVNRPSERRIRLLVSRDLGIAR